MIHLHYFTTRKSGLGDGEFHRYGRETHAPIVTRIPKHKGYIPGHLVPFEINNSTYDGEAEIWLEDLNALEALRKSREFQEGAATDEPNFIDHNVRIFSDRPRSTRSRCQCMSEPPVSYARVCSPNRTLLSSYRCRLAA